MKSLFTLLTLLLLTATVVLAENKPKANKATNTNNVTSYDFTTGADKYYGGSNGAKQIETGVWGMIAGDANGDGGVYAEDYTSYQTNQGQENYNSADFNMDGGVYAEDYTIYQLNQGKETSVPN